MPPKKTSHAGDFASSDTKTAFQINLQIFGLSFELNGTSCWELVLYEFPLVVLHTESVIYFVVHEQR